MSLVITDASVLISLERINRIQLLPDLFGEVIDPPAVLIEFGRSLFWIREMVPEQSRLLKITKETKLDRGEAEAIALAMDQADSILLIDELKGRKLAEYHKIPIIGTFGVVVLAKKRGVVNAAKPILDALIESGFRASEEVYAKALIAAAE